MQDPGEVREPSTRTLVASGNALSVSIELGNDAKTVFSARPDGLVHRWSLETGRLVEAFGTSEHRFRTFAARPDGGAVATGDDEGVLRIWGPDAVKPLRELRGHRPMLSRIAWSPDGSRVATIGQQWEMFLWDPAEDEPLVRFMPADWSGSSCRLAFSPDGRLLAVCMGSDILRLYDAQSGRLERELEASGAHALGMLFSPDGNLLLQWTSQGSDSGWYHVWDVRTGDRRRFGERSWFDDRSGEELHVARFSTDGSRLMAFSIHGAFECRRTTDFEVVSSFHLRGGRGWPPGNRADVHPDRSLLVDYGKGTKPLLFSTEDGRELGALDCVDRYEFTFDHSGTRLIAMREHYLRVYDVASRELLLTRVEYKHGAWLAITPDLSYVATPMAEQWARVGRGGSQPALLPLDPARRNPDAVRASLTRAR